MTLYEEVLAERFGSPVRTDRPRPVVGNIAAILAEQDTPLPRERTGWGCQWAGCTAPAGAVVDGWDTCLRHAGVRTAPERIAV